MNPTPGWFARDTDRTRQWRAHVRGARPAGRGHQRDTIHLLPTATNFPQKPSCSRNGRTHRRYKRLVASRWTTVAHNYRRTQDTMNLIVVPNHEGHRLTYVRHLVDDLHRNGEDYLIAATREAVASRDWSIHLSDQNTVRVVHPASFAPSDVLATASASDARSILLPDGDSWLAWLAVNKVPKSVESLRLLVMRPDGQHSSTVVAAMQTLVKASIRSLVRLRHARVGVLTLTDSHARSWGRWGVPDPVVFTTTQASRDWAKGICGRDSEASGWAAVVGGINARKNIDVVADAVSKSATRIGLIIAGKSSVAPETLEQWMSPMTSAGRPVIVIQDHLSDSELDALILEASCVVLAYTNVGPSGIAGKAMAAGTPVVTAGSRSLHALSRAWPRHVLSTRLSPSDLGRAITTAVSAGRVGGTSGATPSDFAKRLRML